MLLSLYSIGTKKSNPNRTEDTTPSPNIAVSNFIIVCVSILLVDLQVLQNIYKYDHPSQYIDNIS